MEAFPLFQEEECVKLFSESTLRLPLRQEITHH